MYKKQPTKYYYNEMIERLGKAVDFYKETEYKYNDIKVFMSTGKRIEFSFRSQHIPHLLGVDIFKLKASKILAETRPFEMLEELIERAGYVYSKIEKGEINFFEIFSAYIEEKIDSFETILKFDLKDIHFACEYVKKRAYINGEANNYGCEYYIALKNENNNYIFLGLKKDEESRYYAPSSILSCFSKEESEKILKTLIGNQVITLVNNIGFSNTNHYRYLNVNDKMLLIKELINLDDLYGSISNVSSDYLFSLRKVSTSYEVRNISENIISQLVLAINQGKPVSRNAIESAKELDENIYCQLLESYNISLRSASRTDITEEVKELTELRNKLLSTSEKIKQQEKLIEQKDKIISAKEEYIKNQTEELERLREFENESMQLVKKFCHKTDN